jgi:putative FmdB family regulatory protein
MPIYEYQCEQCGHRGEEMRRLSDPPLTVCPQCGGLYKKQISAPAFQFKGSGWYVTDYGKGGSKGGGESGSQGESGAKGESGSKGDSSSAKSESSASEAKPSEGKAEKASSGDSGGKAEKPASS